MSCERAECSTPWLRRTSAAYSDSRNTCRIVNSPSRAHNGIPLASGRTIRIEAMLRTTLTSYFAAALMMPYARFTEAALETRHDIDILQARFGASFEQVAHRLTTLQRVGQRGLPFFMVRIDRAGQFSKSFVGASSARFADAEVSCPLWDAHRAFERGGEMIVQAKILIGLLQVCPRDAPDNFATQLCTAIFLWVHTVY